MIKNHIPVHFSDRRRQAFDRLTRYVVTASAVSVMLVMMMLFLWLIWVVIPLFSSPSFHRAASMSLWQPQPAVALGIDSAQRWAWRIDSRGKGRFIPLNGGPAEPMLALTSQPITLAVKTSQGNGIALLQRDGAVRIVDAHTTDNGSTPVWSFPLGERPLSLQVGAVRSLAVARSDDNLWTIAASGAQGSEIIRQQPGHPPTRILLPTMQASRVILTPDGHRLYTLDENRLQVLQVENHATLRETHTLKMVPQDMQLLGGGQSLLIADSHGVTQWFDVPNEQGSRLTAIRRFQGADGGHHLILEPQRRVFATLSNSGEFVLFSSKREGALTKTQLGADIDHVVFAPQGNGLLVEQQGRWQHYQMNNSWPDISWRSLWAKIWYENYPNPDWVWQSSAASDNYQAKFSLVPMVVGTLKAAGFALLFATPLSLAAAIYTAWFMTPGLRRIVKPAIEMMGALPSVVVGLIAGLWLAPKLGHLLAGILLLPLVLAATLIFCAWLNARLPACWQQRAGREMLVLLPLLLLVSGLTLWLIPALDAWLWHVPLSERLGQGYDQRNLLIAGVAMGFALVPLIFTLAEDALFSVPAELGQGSLALGATPWQTLRHVVLPGASAGIFAALMIGFGRAIGETMIVLMAAGNTPETHGGLFHGLRTLAANIAIETPEAAAGSAHYRVLFLSALVLLVFTLVVNTLAEWVRQRLRQRFQQQGVQ